MDGNFKYLMEIDDQLDIELAKVTSRLIKGEMIKAEH